MIGAKVGKYGMGGRELRVAALPLSGGNAQEVSFAKLRTLVVALDVISL